MFKQCAKKVVSDSPGLVYFAIGQVKCFEEFKLQKNCEIILLIQTFLGLVEMMFGLVNVSFSLPEWQSEFYCFFIFKVSPGSFVFDPFVGTGN